MRLDTCSKPLEQAHLFNGIVEIPHRTLTNMMRTMFSGGNISSGYWSHEIRHAVYIKNRLPQNELSSYITPFQAYTTHCPILAHIRVFGSHVTDNQPRIYKNKLDTTHATTGIFSVSLPIIVLSVPKIAPQVS